ncbi:MAG: Hsp20/alpha crystallin family protein [Verrucomicrobiales bacterium]|nr:Hsp20/alpha crystallin family protein [Verrucomicrobiales bacterium]
MRPSKTVAFPVTSMRLPGIEIGSILSYAVPMSRKVRLTNMIGRTGDVAADLSRLHFSGFQSAQGWVPEINAYRYDDRFEIWVDLAGVEKQHIHVDVLPDRVRISGDRKPPLPTRDTSSQCRQVLTMEIESGRFAREIVLPAEVDRNRVTAKQENGLLWIILPLAKD